MKLVKTLVATTLAFTAFSTFAATVKDDAKDKETKSIKEIIDKYYQGNLDLVNALNEIKMVLITIQSTQKR